MRRRLGTRPLQAPAFPDGDLHRPAQRRFERRERHFTVALHRVAVAQRQQRARHGDGDIQRRSGDELLVVKISGVGTGRPARNAADQRMGRDTDGSEKGRELQHDARRERRRARARVEAHEMKAHERELVGQRPAAGYEAADAVRVQELEADDLHFEHIARLGALDEDGAGHRMRAGTALRHGALDGLQRVRDLVFLHAGRPQPLQSPRDHRLDTNRVS